MKKEEEGRGRKMQKDEREERKRERETSIRAVKPTDSAMLLKLHIWQHRAYAKMAFEFEMRKRKEKRN